MSPVAKTLTYDAVALALAGVVVAFTDGAPQYVAWVIGGGTLLKAPYDVWEARRTGID